VRRAAGRALLGSFLASGRTRRGRVFRGPRSCVP